MKRTLTWLVIFGGWALLLPPARASLAVRLGLDDLVKGASRIVAVRCLGAARTFTSPDGKRIFTQFDFEAEEELAGSGPRHFSIVQPGGTFGRVRQKTWGYPEFGAGERLVLFLADSERGPRVMGVGQGVFVWEDTEAGRFLWQRLEGLSFSNGSRAPLRFSLSELREKVGRIFRGGEVAK